MKDGLSMLKNIITSICFAIFFSLFLQAAVVPVGAGRYTTTLPNGALPPSDVNNKPVYPKVTSTFTQLPLTHKWWSSIIWSFFPEQPWSLPLFAHPLSFQAQAQGLQLGYPNSYTLTAYAPTIGSYKAQEYHYPHVNDLFLSVVGLNSPDTKVSHYSDWAVTANWSGNGQAMEATMGRGFPFVYITKEGGEALISFKSAPKIWYNKEGVIGLTINGHLYGIFAPQGSVWTIGTNQLQSNLNNKNYYSVAILPDNSLGTLEVFRKHAYAFVENTHVSWDYNQSDALLTTTFTARTILMEPGPNNSNVNRPLMALYRHQWLNSDAEFLPYTYASPRGTMKVVDSTQFSTHYSFSGVLPFLPFFAKEGVDTFSGSQLYGYVDSVYRQSYADRWALVSSNIYYSGKALARVAHLIPIADQMQHTAARNLFLNELKQEMQKWLSGQDASKTFYYDSTWKTLIAYPSGFGSDTQLNDHAFHYGYLLMAAAIIGHYDPSWISECQWGGMINLLVKDVSNPNQADIDFPYLRYFDMYEGHSWTSGPNVFAAGNNEESSSEDLQFSTALILWGSITNNTTLRDLGIYLYTHQAATIPQYWFDKDGQVFPSKFVPPTAGILWGDGAAYTIWWPGSIAEVHGINFLPINPGMLYLSQYPTYLKKNQTFMLNNLGGKLTTWADIHWSIKSLYDPLGAISDFNANKNYATEGGETKAHTYHWIHNMNRLGNQEPAVTANIPTYAVFNRKGTRIYVAYNPYAVPITVTFSDGTLLNVQPKSLNSTGG